MAIYKTEVQPINVRGMEGLIEGASTSPLQALSKSMGELSGHLDNRVKEKYTTSALDRLKGIDTTEGLIGSNIDVSKLSDEGKLQYQNLSGLVKQQEAQKLGLDKLALEEKKLGIAKDTTPATIKEMTALGYPQTQEGFQSYISDKESGKTKSKGTPLKVIDASGKVVLKYPEDAVGMTPYVEGGKSKGFDTKVDSFGRIVTTNKDTGEIKIQGANGEVAPLSSPITNKTPTVTTDDGKVVYIDPAGKPIVDNQGNPVIKEFSKKSQKAERERLVKAKSLSKSKTAKLNNVTKKLRTLLTRDALTEPISGVTGAIASYYPGSTRQRAEKLVSEIESVLSFETLQAMRDASPTGGALGQVSEKELELLKANLGAIDLNQPPEVVNQQLDSVLNNYQAIVDGGEISAVIGATKDGQTVYEDRTGKYIMVDGNKKRMKSGVK